MQGLSKNVILTLLIPLLIIPLLIRTRIRIPHLDLGLPLPRSIVEHKRHHRGRQCQWVLHLANPLVIDIQHHEAEGGMRVVVVETMIAIEKEKEKEIEEAAVQVGI